MNRILVSIVTAGLVWVTAAGVASADRLSELKAVAKVQYTRIYTDSEGETHFEDLEIELAEVDFAPPAPPVKLSAFTSATQWAFFAIPPGWNGDWHPTPRRQIFFYLVGQTEIEVTDGTIRRFGPGDAIIVEDTTGKGHRSRVIGEETALQAVVQMPDDE